MRKIGLAVVLVFAAGSLLSCRSAPGALTSQEIVVHGAFGSTVFVGHAVRATTEYFRRYSPRVVSNDGSQAVVSAQFGRHPVTVNISSLGDNRIALESTAEPSRIQYWLNNLQQRTNNHITRAGGAAPPAAAAVAGAAATGAAPRTVTSAVGIEGALERATHEVARSFNAYSRIAIVHISAPDRSTTDFITGELEHILRRRGYIIVDRFELDRIRTEQRLGLGGEVDDGTAARIGQFAGATTVITGGVDGEGNLRRLRLRALDTATARVAGTASEAF